MTGNNSMQYRHSEGSASLLEAFMLSWQQGKPMEGFPAVMPKQSSFDQHALQQISKGQLYGVVGEGYELSAAHMCPLQFQLNAVTHLSSLLTRDSQSKNGFTEYQLKLNTTDLTESALSLMSTEMLQLALNLFGYTLSRDAYLYTPLTYEKCDWFVSASSFPDTLLARVFYRELQMDPAPQLIADIIFYSGEQPLAALSSCRLGLTPSVPYDGHTVNSRVLPEIKSSIAAFKQRTQQADLNKPNAFMTSNDVLTWSLGPIEQALKERAQGFGGEKRFCRVPLPPLLLMDRVLYKTGADGLSASIGQEYVCEFDVDPEDWYFKSSTTSTAPFSVLLEIALQPFSLNIMDATFDFIKSQSIEKNLFVRNLDGDCVMHGEIFPDAGTLRVTSKLLQLAKMSDTLIATFRNAIYQGERCLFEVNTVSGMFTQEALENQTGLAPTEEEKSAIEAPANYQLDFKADSSKFFEPSLSLPAGDMLLIDGLNGYWPQGGTHGLGRVRAEKVICPDDWFFHAHFYRDPVMPGSLGIEAILQTLQAYMIDSGVADQLTVPRFESILTNSQFKYKYRGQVSTHNKKMTVIADIIEQKQSASGDAVELKANASLWADGKCIYRVHDIGMRALSQEAPSKLSETVSSDPSLFSRQRLNQLEQGHFLAALGSGYEVLDSQIQAVSLDFAMIDHIQFSQNDGIDCATVVMEAGQVSSRDVLIQAAENSLKLQVVRLGKTLSRDYYEFTAQPVGLAHISEGPFTCHQLTLEQISVDDLGNVSAVAEFDCGSERFSVPLQLTFAEKIVSAVSPEFSSSDPDVLAEVRRFIQKGQAYEQTSEHQGLALNWQQLLEWSVGDLAITWGESFKKFRGDLRMGRIPFPPLLLMDRCLEINPGDRAKLCKGGFVECEYETHGDDWYFALGQNDTTPFSILLEVALQPFAINMASIVQALNEQSPVQETLYVRNLDGDCILHKEIRAGHSKLHVRSEITQVSALGGVILVSLKHWVRQDNELVFEIDTVSGLFDKVSLDKQVGHAPRDEELQQLAAEANQQIDLKTFNQSSGKAAKLPEGKMLILDTVDGHWLAGGSSQLGLVRGIKDIKADDWFFKSHFFRDPVMPGSLGLEAILQLIQYHMAQSGLLDGMSAPRFHPVSCGNRFKYKYRGHVVPGVQKIAVLVDVKKVEKPSAQQLDVTVDASLWADGVCLYRAYDMGMTAVDDVASPVKKKSFESKGADSKLKKTPLLGHLVEAAPGKLCFEKKWSLATEPWLQDHCPTDVIPTMPFAGMLEIMSQSLQTEFPNYHLQEIIHARVGGWLTFSQGDQHVKTEVTYQSDDDGILAQIRLLKRQEDVVKGLTRFEEFCVGSLRFAPERAEAPETATLQAFRLAAPHDSKESIYTSGYLCAGPEFRLLSGFVDLEPGLRRAQIDLRDTGPGTNAMRLTKIIDGVAQAMPHYEAAEYHPEIEPGLAGFPYQVRNLRFYGPIPRDEQLSVQIKFIGLDGFKRFPQYEAKIFLERDKGLELWATLLWTEVLAPMNIEKFGAWPTPAIRQFVRDHKPLAGFTLSEPDGDQGMRCSLAKVKARDMIPGMTAKIYLEEESEFDEYEQKERASALKWLTEQIVAKELIAEQWQVHPAKVLLQSMRPGLWEASCASLPLMTAQVETTEADQVYQANLVGSASLDTSPIRTWWKDYFASSTGLIETLGESIVQTFLGKVVLADPEAHAQLQGQPRIYLANHQTFIESLVFNSVFSALDKKPITFLAKQQHRQEFLGKFDELCGAFPGANKPETVLYVDRERPEDIIRAVDSMKHILCEKKQSILVHVEGRRSYQAQDKIEKLSSLWVDLAVATGLPIVPVRFLCGLPSENPEQKKYDFPVGYGRQDIYVGAPLSAEDLAQLPFAQRAEQVRQAINALGCEQESRVSAGNPSLQQAIEAHHNYFSSDEAAAAMCQALRHQVALPQLDKVSQACTVKGLLPALLYAGELAQQGSQVVNLQVASDAHKAWLQALTAWFYGSQGPKIVSSQEAAASNDLQVVVA